MTADRAAAVGADTGSRVGDAPEAVSANADDDLLTVDELAARTQMTVRTTRYYASLGLLPAPVRRGRVAYYTAGHLARLQLVRALQDHGYTLAAIERHLAHVPLDSTPEEMAVHRAILTAWKPGRWDEMDRRALDARAGRRLTEEDLAWLSEAGAVRRIAPDSYRAHPLVHLAVELRDADVPLDSITEAEAAVRRHMSQLADELSALLTRRVVSQYRRSDLSMADAERFEHTLHNLRTLTLDAIVHAFQSAAAQLAAETRLDGEA